MSYQDTYGFVGAMPPGVTVADNVARAQAFQRTHTPAETVQWFNEIFRNNKDGHLSSSESMDFKQIDSIYASFGNFNYGVVGRVLGFPNWVLEYGAGYAQGRADGLSFEQTVYRSILDLKNKGDNSEDQALIRAGMLAADFSGVSKSDIGVMNYLSQSTASNFKKNWTGDTLRLAAPGVSLLINTLFNNAKSWTAPRDPLVLDLDGDGIETAGIDPTAPVLFDMDGDGVKTATGWIRPDDGIVVLDRNGNGLIDSGRELFGDATVLARGARAGQLAANGFEALADLDLNADGRLDSLDASWGQLRIWRDLNQDGVSQAGELTTLAAQGIASLGAQGTQSNVNLGGGNTQVMSGSFTRTNGMLGTSGVAEVAGSLLLASNNFYRDFTDEVALTPAAQSLPQMQGSGLVRDLREAMSLGTAQAGALRAAVAVFGAGSECSLDTPKSIAGCKSGSSAKGRFDAQKRICGRRGLTRADFSEEQRIGAAIWKMGDLMLCGAQRAVVTQLGADAVFTFDVCSRDENR